MTKEEQGKLLKMSARTDLKLAPIVIEGERGVAYQKMRTTNFRRAFVDVTVFWANTVNPAVVGVGR